MALDLYFDQNRGPIDKSNPRVIELSGLLNKLPIFEYRPDQEKFRNANGVGLKLSNFLALDENYKGKGMESYSKLDKEVFDHYSKNKDALHAIANQIRTATLDENLSKQISYIETDETDVLDSVNEGQVLYRLHKVRERDHRIIESKKRIVYNQLGRLDCEACKFNFELKYGLLGKGFIECHHITPLSKLDGSKTTKVDDLVLVCSNCHRMLHKDISIITIDDLKGKILPHTFSP